MTETDPGGQSSALPAQALTAVAADAVAASVSQQDSERSRANTPSKVSDDPHV